MNPSRRPQRSRVLSVAVVNQRREIARLGCVVDQFGKECGLPDDDTSNINLMLDEVVSNVIKYGYEDTLEHQITVNVTIEQDAVILRVEDDGKPFNPLDAPAPDLDLPIEERPIGGLGVFIVKSIADSLDYRRENGRNVVTMRKKRN